MASFPLRYPGTQRATFVTEGGRADAVSAATNHLLVRIAKDEKKSSRAMDLSRGKITFCVYRGISEKGAENQALIVGRLKGCGWLIRQLAKRVTTGYTPDAFGAPPRPPLPLRR